MSSWVKSEFHPFPDVNIVERFPTPEITITIKISPMLNLCIFDEEIDNVENLDDIIIPTGDEVTIYIPLFDFWGVFHHKSSPHTSYQPPFTLRDILYLINADAKQAGIWDAQYHPEHYAFTPVEDGSDFYDEYALTDIEVTGNAVYIDFQH
jgi:hypothetical protein